MSYYPLDLKWYDSGWFMSLVVVIAVISMLAIAHTLATWNMCEEQSPQFQWHDRCDKIDGHTGEHQNNRYGGQEFWNTDDDWRWQMRNTK